MKKGFVPKRLLLIDIQESIAALWKAISTPMVSDLPSMTLAQLNAHITDANVDADSEQREPTPHRTTHYANGTDDLIGMHVLSNDTGGFMCDDTTKYPMIWSR